MAVAVVVFNGTRVDSLDTNSNTGHWVGGGGAPSAEAQNAYQNALCVNKKTTSTSLAGIDFDPGSGAVDMTGTTNPLWFVKVYVTDAFSLNTTFGVAAGIGSALTAYYKYNIAGTGAKLSVYNSYPAQGGYLLTAIDPNIAAWRDVSGTGSPALNAVDWFGVQCAFASTGSAKSENLAFDAIDVGTGLTITAGDGAGPKGNFAVFVEKDQDAPTVRWGCVSGSGNAVKAWCKLTIGTASITEFLDTTSVVTFTDGYHSAGLVGVAVGMSNASSDIQIDSLLIGEGAVQSPVANDTRPDFVVTGTSGTFSCAATMRNFRNVTFTSICTVDGADIEAQLLTQASADIENSTIRTNALTSIACLQDPTFGTTTDLNNTDFIQSGVGHAIELSTVDGTYTFTGLTFTGYGADTTDDAALDITAASGTTTINYSGTAPTFKTAGASVNLVASYDIAIHIQDEDGAAIQDAQVYIQKTSPTAFTSGAGNAAGDGDFVVTQTIDSDIPTSGYIRVTDDSLNLVFGYRYTTQSVSTFTFPTTFAGTTNSAGTSTQLLDSTADFGNADDIEEGDTIINTTDSPNSYAVVDEIVSTTELQTSALTGGSANTWASGDGYSVNDLATAGESAVDTVDAPLYIGQTDGSGDVATTYGGVSDRAVTIRVRANNASTKYIPLTTSATIDVTGGTGLTATYVLTQDTVAT